ncbi:MAG: Mitochondrial intermediate peptidase [Phylliscum demangeonii]|nr:MAG: Mitochondrial intermediate peptidase [Phylliscum demangeonii]
MQTTVQFHLDMLKLSLKPSWTCPRCLQQQPRVRAAFSTATKTPPARLIKRASRAAYPGHFLVSASYSQTSSTKDDDVLRKVFDSPSFWKTYGQASGRTGLFQNVYLQKAEGFKAFASDALAKAKRLVRKIQLISDLDGYKGVVRDLDRLSDLLCRVIDLCDFVQTIHPDAQVRRAATPAYAAMFEYMNVLNTTSDLYHQLKKAMDTPEVVDSWSEEEKITAQILMRDFSRSAIDLPPGQREEFVRLSNQVNRVGYEFVSKVAPAKAYLELPARKVPELNPTPAKLFQRRRNHVLSTSGPETTMALRSVRDEEVRKQIYVASRAAHGRQIRRLEELLELRAELAKLSGFRTYADMALEDKMAKTPETVSKFLQALLHQNRARVQAEDSLLGQLKREEQVMHLEALSPLAAWDRDYYRARWTSRVHKETGQPDSLSAFFSLGTVMQGLSRLFTHLYGVRFVSRAPKHGEVWHDDVRCLDVMDEREGRIGVMYCDLCARADKSPNAAHYTLRCARRISGEEMHESEQVSAETSALELNELNNAIDISRSDPITAVTDGMAWTRNPQGELHQLPTIALICNFTRSMDGADDNADAGAHPPPPTLLTFREVQTLFHEMGHGMHSVLGRTEFQNVSGTRCATDLSELPSVLMEHFVRAPEVLALFARHWHTDVALPYPYIHTQMAIDQRFEGSDIQTQISLAILDQVYHGRPPRSAADAPAFSSTAAYHAVMEQYALAPEPAGTSWHGLFGHLSGYGATYYAYLFDRALAGRIWKELFQRKDGDGDSEGKGDGAISREAGARFREEVLRWGGSRDGWRCVAGVLNDPGLAEGGPAAMARVGEWGVHG